MLLEWTYFERTEDCDPWRGPESSQGGLTHGKFQRWFIEYHAYRRKRNRLAKKSCLSSTPQKKATVEKEIEGTHPKKLQSLLQFPNLHPFSGPKPIAGEEGTCTPTAGL
jgi:hypothetical protein